LQTGAFTVGDFSLFVTYLAFISEFVAFIGMMWARYKQAGVAISRMVRLLQGAPPLNLVKPGPIYMDREMDVPYTPKTAQHRLAELVVHNLSFRYPDSQRGIEDISLCLTRGKMTVITGRIGSGKTTLVRVLLGLLPKDRGEIRWNGELVEQPADFFTPPRSAYTAQVPRLFNNTLRDNLLMGLPAAQMDLDKAIQAAVMEKDLGDGWLERR
jgi:ATP-binding cassette subfamily B protein